MGKSTELKELANMAKQRMKNASYSKEKYTTVNSISRNSYFYKNLVSLKKVSGGVEFVTISDNEDSEFIKKVFEMLSSGNDIYNPIGRLTDQEYFGTLSNNDKEFYILRMVDKYNKAKELYNSSLR